MKNKIKTVKLINWIEFLIFFNFIFDNEFIHYIKDVNE